MSTTARPAGPDASRILFVHNRYQDRAGEDLSYDADKRSLVDHGIEVAEYVRDNLEIERAGSFEKLRIAVQTSWSSRARSAVREAIEKVRPDVVHFHNTFPLISPAPYWACRDAGVPVVQTVRNFRMFCAPGIFFRDGHICEDCVGKRVAWPGVLHECYQDSRSKSAAVAMMQTTHRSIRTWARLVQAYVVPSSFLRDKLAECGLPEDRIHVRPDVVDVDQANDHSTEEWCLYLGRLTMEKGVKTLIEAVRRVDGLRLKVAGTGTIEGALRDLVSRDPDLTRIELLGSVSHEEGISLIKRARFVVIPSEWYETFGRVAVEAFACGTPVLASRLGALEEVVESGSTGLQFRPGDPDDLVKALAWARDNPREMAEMGQRGRAVYETRYAPRAALDGLLEVYDRVSG